MSLFADPLKPLGIGAFALSLIAGGLSFDITRAVTLSGGHPFRLPYFLVPAVGALGLLVAWAGWRRVGSILMALCGVGFALGGGLLAISFWFTPIAPFVALAGGLWIGAALSWRKPNKHRINAERA